MCGVFLVWLVVLCPHGVGFCAVSAELGGFGGVSGKFDVTVKINHDGEVNRARYCPQNSFWIATKTVTGVVNVFDYSKHPSQPADDVCRPEIKCLGHEKEGYALPAFSDVAPWRAVADIPPLHCACSYGLCWNPHTEGQLLSGADDMLVCTWDIKSTSSKNATLDASNTYRGHTSVVEVRTASVSRDCVRAGCHGLSCCCAGCRLASPSQGFVRLRGR